MWSFLSNRLTNLAIPIKISHFLVNLRKICPRREKTPMAINRSSELTVWSSSKWNITDRYFLWATDYDIRPSLQSKAWREMLTPCITKVPRNLFPCNTQLQFCLETKIWSSKRLPTGMKKTIKKSEFLSF